MALFPMWTSFFMGKSLDGDFLHVEIQAHPSAYHRFRSVRADIGTWPVWGKSSSSAMTSNFLKKIYICYTFLVDLAKNILFQGAE